MSPVRNEKGDRADPPERRVAGTGPVLLSFYAALAAVALAEIVLPRMFHADHTYFRFERLPAWGSLYGFVSCVAIIVVSKVLGKFWLKRGEGYYDS